MISNLKRAYDNAIVLREEIGSESLSHIQLAIYEMQKAGMSEAPMLEFQKVLDNLMAFWGIVDDEIASENVRNILKVGKRVERIDLYGRLHSSRGRDSFGNPLLTGRIESAHDWFLVKVEAMVLAENMPEPELKAEYQLGMYRAFTKYTGVGERLEEFYRRLPPAESKDPWVRTGEWMKYLFSNFRYESGATSFETTAEETLAQGCGVCQDYAHILLALCKREGMTVRYVAGAIPGEGQTHAWIEVWKDGFWKGFDPTNNREADESYIRFAYGRDAHDCSLNQGIFVGGGNQKQYIYVRMEEQ